MIEKPKTKKNKQKNDMAFVQNKAHLKEETIHN